MKKNKIENKNIPTKALPFVLNIAKKYKWKIAIYYIFVLIIGGVFVFVSPFFCKMLLNETTNGTLTYQNSVYYALGFGILFSINFLIEGLIEPLKNSIECKIEHNIETTMFENATNHELNYFNNNLSGSLNNKILKISKNICGIFNGAPSMIGTNVCFAINFFILFRMDYRLSIFSILWYITVFWIRFKDLKKFKDSSENEQERINKSIGVINDCFVNIFNIKIFSKQRQEFWVLKKQRSQILRAMFEKTKVFGISNLIFYLTVSIYMAGMSLISFMDFLHGKIDSGSFVFVVSISSIICFFVNNAIEQLFDIMEKLGSIENSLKILTEPIKINDKPNAKELKIIEGKIVFKAVKFNYKNKSV
jgi:ATP-binding cassette subfamily B protein